MGTVRSCWGSAWQGRVSQMIPGFCLRSQAHCPQNCVPCDTVCPSWFDQLMNLNGGRGGVGLREVGENQEIGFCLFVCFVCLLHLGGWSVRTDRDTDRYTDRCKNCTDRRDRERRVLILKPSPCGLYGLYSFYNGL